MKAFTHFLWVVLLMFSTSLMANGVEYNKKVENNLKAHDLVSSIVYHIRPITSKDVGNLSEHYLTNLATAIYLHNHSFLNLDKDHKQSLDCMIRNVYMEARGEDLKGKMLVASVVINRSKDQHYPSTICGVVYQPHQFSWTSNKKVISHFHKISTVENKYSDKEYRESVWAGFYTVLFHGSLKTKAVAYYAPKGVKKAPAWSNSKGFKFWGKHGGHMFFIASDATFTKTQGSARSRT